MVGHKANKPHLSIERRPACGDRVYGSGGSTVTNEQRRVLEYAASVNTVSEWPKSIPDGPIRECRALGWLETWVVSGIQMAQVVFRGGDPWRDRITEMGRDALREAVTQEVDNG